LINYKSDPKWGRSAAALAGGQGVDAIVEVGGPGTLSQSIQACRIGGHISLIGVLTGFAGEEASVCPNIGDWRKQRDMLLSRNARRP
jgi:threonine dehydrogenase-like Zn-dependent dehydrogenase